MKNKTIKVLALLIILVSIAQITEAAITVGDTGPYTKEQGKKLLFYGELISEVKIHYWDADNISNTYSVSVPLEGNGLTSYTYQITNTWNTNYILWSADIQTNVTTYHFEGGFSINNEGINMSQFVNEFALMNSTIISSRAGIETDIQNTISTYNEGLVNKLQSMGLTDNQSAQIANLIQTTSNATIKTHDQQKLENLANYNNGYNTAMSYLIYTIIIEIIIGVVVISIFRGWRPSLRRNKKENHSPSDTAFDLDSFKLT